MTQKLYDQLINSPRGMSAATIRDVLLPLVLGTETNGILYWIGKDLARQYPVATTDELVALTHQLGLGTLTRVRQQRTATTWQLSGPVVSERMALQKENTSFTLEAGFLAKQIEFQTNRVTEATVVEKKKNKVTLVTESEPTAEGETEIADFIHPLGIDAAELAPATKDNAVADEAPAPQEVAAPTPDDDNLPTEAETPTDEATEPAPAPEAPATPTRSQAKKMSRAERRAEKARLKAEKKQAKLAAKEAKKAAHQQKRAEKRG